jgi:hypothetical protein
MQYEVTAEIIIFPWSSMPIVKTEVLIDYDAEVYCYQNEHITRFKEGRFRELSSDRFLKDLQRLIDRVTKSCHYEVKNAAYGDYGVCFIDGDYGVCDSGVKYFKNNGFLKDDKYTGKKVSRSDLKFAFVNCAWIRILLKRYK